MRKPTIITAIASLLLLAAAPQDQHRERKYIIAHTEKHIMDQAPSDKALIYIIRPDIIGPFKTWMFADDRLVAVNRDQTCTGGLVDPGERLFWSKLVRRIDAIKLHVEAGKTYYLWWKSATFQLVPLSEAKGQSMLRDCYTYVTHTDKAIAKAQTYIKKLYSQAQEQARAAVAALEPTFKWDARYATPGTSLTLEERERVKSKQGGTLIFYEVLASGFTGPAVLWRKSGSSYARSPATIDESGTVRVAESDKIAIGGLVPGEALDIALVAGDKRAHAKTIPFPIEAREANCSASVELVTESGFVFVITFSGFQPGEAVQITSQYKKERNVITTPASKRGEVRLPVLFGPGDRGTAIATATVRGCTVSVQYKVGRDAIVLQ